MNEQTKMKEEDFEPQARPTSRRIAFCPTCGRPFLRGMGFWPPQFVEKAKINGGDPSKRAETDPECVEYCSEECLPGLPA